MNKNHGSTFTKAGFSIKIVMVKNEVIVENVGNSAVLMEMKHAYVPIYFNNYALECGGEI